VKAGQHISSLDYILPYVITPRPSYSIPFHSIIIAIYPLLRIFLLSHAGSHSLFSRARALSLSPISLGHLQEFVFAMTPLHNQVRTPRPPLPPLFQALRAGEGRGDIGADDCPPPPPPPLPIGQAPTCPWEDTVRVFREEFDSHPDIMYHHPPPTTHPPTTPYQLPRYQRPRTNDPPTTPYQHTLRRRGGRVAN
jgi:hypothetical protein